MTTTNASQAGFPSLATETRLMIYRLLLCRADVIGTWSPGKKQWPNDPIRLSAQLLRTCKQICAEGLPILYGENTFEIKISNTHGPHYGCLDVPEALGGYLDPCQARMRFKQAVVPHLRRLSILVRYTEDAEILQERLQTTGEEEDGSRAPSLSDIYLELEECARDIGFCEEDLGCALVAAEGDDKVGFQECKNDIFESLKKHWETINSKERLWQF